MGLADLHAHTCHDGWGDGNQPVEELLNWVEEETDLDLFAITDHDSTVAARAALELHRHRRYRFGFLPGVEVTNQAGHLLCYFPGGEIADIPSLRPFWWTVRYAQARGAICVPAHPIYPPWLAPTIERGFRCGLRLDAVEAINGGIGRKAQQRLDRTAARLAPLLPLVGNSDAHDQHAVGAVCTRFPGNTLDDFLLALKHRQTEPMFVRYPEIPPEAVRFTNRRALTRPGWVRNLWRELSPGSYD